MPSRDLRGVFCEVVRYGTIRAADLHPRIREVSASMSFARLLRLAGLAALLAGVSSGIGDVVSIVVDLEDPGVALTAPHGIVFGLYLVSSVLLLLGLVGLYANQSRASGTLGFAGFVAAFVGSALTTGAVWYELFVTPELTASAPELAASELGIAGFILSFLLAAVGWLIFAAATLRARVYPRAAGGLLLAGAIVSLAPLFVRIPASGLVLSGAVAWLGFILFRGRELLDTDSVPPTPTPTPTLE